MDKTYRQLSREEKRRQRRASAKYRLAHATRERMRVEVSVEIFSYIETSRVLKYFHCVSTPALLCHHRYKVFVGDFHERLLSGEVIVEIFSWCWVFYMCPDAIKNHWKVYWVHWVGIHGIRELIGPDPHRMDQSKSYKSIQSTIKPTKKSLDSQSLYWSVIV